MTSTRTTTITLRVSHQNLDRIDDAAKRAGQDRNAYILGWVPEYEDGVHNPPVARARVSVPDRGDGPPAR
jgi:hypothetical protein